PLWGESDWGRSGAEAPCGAVGTWSRRPECGEGAWGCSREKSPYGVRGHGAGIGKELHVELGRRKAAGGAQGLPFAGRDAGICHLPTHGPPVVSPAGDTGHTGALTSLQGVGKVRTEGHRNLSWWMNCFTFNIIFWCKSHLCVSPPQLSDGELFLPSLYESS
ncbi:hypothetical protein Nmel_000071, partial [Mimus melanotis]